MSVINSETLTSEHTARTLEAIEAHGKWLSSRRTSGEPVNFSECSFENMDLMNVDFRAADLSGSDFSGSNLKGANFHDAVLQDANFELAKGITSKQIAGADLSGAKLPASIAAFEGLNQIEQVSGRSANTFLVLLVGTLYCLIVAPSASDAEILTDAATFTLPVIGSKVPPSGFFVLGPAIICSLFLYLHLYLQRLMRQQASLPSIFPDGQSLYDRVYPWILGSALIPPRPILRNSRTRPHLYFVKLLAVFFLFFVSVPVVLILYWAIYLKAHSLYISIVQIILIVISVGVSALTLYLRYRFAGSDPKYRITLKRTIAFLSIASLLTVAISTIVLSILIIEHTPSVSESGEAICENGPAVFIERLGVSVFASINEDDSLSRIPENLNSNTADIPLDNVWGANLIERNLRCIDAPNAFLARAKLEGASLQGSRLVGADLRRAKLRNARLNHAKISRATFSEAKMVHAVLYKVQAIKVDFSRAALNCADLRDGTFHDSNFENASLVGADLRGADLLGAKIKESQLKTACIDRTTVVDFSIQGLLNESCEAKRKTSCAGIQN